MNTEILQKAANQARGLAIDAIFDKASGHMGLPLGCAEIGAVLYGNLLNVNPSEPRWLKVVWGQGYKMEPDTSHKAGGGAS